MSCAPKCLPPKGQKLFFPGTGGPILVLGEGRAAATCYSSQLPCCPTDPNPTCRPPQGTIVFFAPPQPVPPPGPGPRPQPGRPPVPILSYGNTEQTCVNECPIGTVGADISVTVPAGAYSSGVSQEAANAAAMEAACAEAALLRESSPCTTPGVVGSLWGWGDNQYRQLGMGSDSSIRYMPAIVGETDFEVEWVFVRGGTSATYGIKEDGSLWSWGENFNGALGLGNSEGIPQFFPTRIGTDNDWVKVSGGRYHGLAIKTDGTLWVWGGNAAGELGLGDTVDRFVPEQVGVDTWLEVAAGNRFSLALRSDGTIWGCGSNNTGQCALGVGVNFDVLTFTQEASLSSDWVHVEANYQNSGAIKSDGTIWLWGGWNYTRLAGNPLNYLPEQLGPDTDWESINCGALVTIGKKTDGTLWGVGLNSVGSLGTGDLVSSTTWVSSAGGASDWDKITCSHGNTYGLKSDGTIWGCGQGIFLGQGGPSTVEPTFLQIGPDDLWTGIAAGVSCGFGFRSVLTPPPPPPGSSGVALGGVFSRIGGYDIHTFETPGDLVIVNSAGVLFDILWVGPGAGGGGWGGGGGAQVFEQLNVTIGNGTYSVTIGLGGNAGGGENQGSDGNGTTTFFGTIAVGGAGGGAFTDNGNEVGRSGPSGGGGGVTFPFGPGAVGGTGFPYGTGGTGSYTGPSHLSGGGGGAIGGNGANGTSSVGTGVGGTGGAGFASSLSGTLTRYGAGGGGGGSTVPGQGGSSGSGGLGAGGTNNDGGPGGTPGSGGGGALGNTFGGVGARGMVIIRYLTPP